MSALNAWTTTFGDREEEVKIVQINSGKLWICKRETVGSHIRKGLSCVMTTKTVYRDTEEGEEAEEITERSFVVRDALSGRSGSHRVLSDAVHVFKTIGKPVEGGGVCSLVFSAKSTHTVFRVTSDFMHDLADHIVETYGDGKRTLQEVAERYFLRSKHVPKQHYALRRKAGTQEEPRICVRNSEVREHIDFLKRIFEYKHRRGEEEERARLKEQFRAEHDQYVSDLKEREIKLNAQAHINAIRSQVEYIPSRRDVDLNRKTLRDVLRMLVSGIKRSEEDDVPFLYKKNSEKARGSVLFTGDSKMPVVNPDDVPALLALVDEIATEPPVPIWPRAEKLAKSFDDWRLWTDKKERKRSKPSAGDGGSIEP